MGARLSFVAPTTTAQPPLRMVIVFGIPLEPLHHARLTSLFDEIIHAENDKESIAPSDLEKADVIYGVLPFLEGSAQGPAFCSKASTYHENFVALG
jgi:hypothetical protein